mmetsp:Transcript_37751/g.107859  ORF Transcript_37751/g.107859 Transcript_37751/m.107859 type:complete len:448 (-) Transcript_37751:1778-3121(-)
MGIRMADRRHLGLFPSCWSLWFRQPPVIRCSLELSFCTAPRFCLRARTCPIALALLNLWHGCRLRLWRGHFLLLPSPPRIAALPLAFVPFLCVLLPKFSRHCLPPLFLLFFHFLPKIVFLSLLPLLRFTLPALLCSPSADVLPHDLAHLLDRGGDSRLPLQLFCHRSCLLPHLRVRRGPAQGFLKLGDLQHLHVRGLYTNTHPLDPVAVHGLVIAQGHYNRRHSRPHGRRRGASSAMVDAAGAARKEPLVGGLVDEQHVRLGILAEPRAALRVGRLGFLQRGGAEIAPAPDHHGPQAEVPQRLDQRDNEARESRHAPPAHVRGRRPVHEEVLQLLQQLRTTEGIRLVLLLLLVVDPEACELPVPGNNLVLMGQRVDDQLCRPEQPVLRVVEMSKLLFAHSLHHGYTRCPLHDHPIEGTQGIEIEGVFSPGSKVELQAQVCKNCPDTI